MDRTERFYKIDLLLSSGSAVSRKVLMDELGVSLATLKRDLEYMRDRLNAPIVWDRAKNGYVFSDSQSKDFHFRLPGIWFNPSEIYALITMHHLLENLQPGILSPHISPLLTRLKAILDGSDKVSEEVFRRVRIIGMAIRKIEHPQFEVIGAAIVQRRKLKIVYASRSKDEIVERVVSPQRLVHYRENWYLDAWCHLRNSLRTFAVDRIARAELLNEAAEDLDDEDLDEELGSGYGIISGRNTSWAKLKFNPSRARWVASESWHPNQRSYFDDRGSLILEVPYSDDHELLMDILKYGSDVEVISPATLRDRVIVELVRAGKQYSE